MRQRVKLVSALLTAALFLSLVPRTHADPPSWTGRHKHEKAEKHWRDRDDWRHDHGDRWARYDHDDWHRRHGWWERDRDHERRWWDDDHRDRRSWDREHRYGWYGSRGGYVNSSVCNGVWGRMQNDRSKMAEIAPTGRHRKALQWYRDDLRNAERDLSNCRG